MSCYTGGCLSTYTPPLSHEDRVGVANCMYAKSSVHDSQTCCGNYRPGRGLIECEPDVLVAMHMSKVLGSGPCEITKHLLSQLMGIGRSAGASYMPATLNDI